MAVIGAGGLGMAAIVLAQAKGAQSVLAVDIQPNKLQSAAAIGAQTFLLPSSSPSSSSHNGDEREALEIKRSELKNQASQIKELFGSHKGPDLILELVGSSESTGLVS